MRSFMFVAGLGVGVFIAASASADPAGSPPLPTPDATAPSTAAPSSSSTLAPSGAPSREAPAQQAPVIGEEERTANNAVYVEGLGPGILYSINYERSLSDFALRVGFGYVSVSATSNSGSTQTQASASIITVPITLSYLGVGSKTNIFELGVGATILHAGEGASSIDTDSSATASGSATVVLPHAVVGYRYMPPGGGFLFRVGISPIFAGDAIAVLPLPYLALGGVF
jgi:hypothetical protein